MKQNSKRLTSIVLALLFVVAALVLFFNLVEPEYGNMETLKGQAIGEQNFLAAENQAVTQAQQLITQYNSQSQGEQNAALAMPTGPDIAGALAQVYGLAQSNGIAVKGISVSAPTLQAQAASPTQVVEPLGSVLLQVSAAGSYESLKSFLAGLETNIRIFNVQSLSVQPVTATVVVGKNSVATIQDLFNYTVSVAVYYQTPSQTSTQTP